MWELKNVLINSFSQLAAGGLGFPSLPTPQNPNPKKIPPKAAYGGLGVFPSPHNRATHPS